MNKFNLPRRSLLKDRRAKRASRRRLQSGNTSMKVAAVRLERPISGKQKRKQLKEWRRAQKQVIESGLVSLQDIEMMAVDHADGASELQEQKHPFKLQMKRKLRIALKKSKKKGKDVNLSEDVMVE